MASLSRKRRLEEEKEDDYSAGIETEITKFGKTSNKKNTIESDDEDADEEEYNKQKYDIIEEDDIEGQEDKTLEFDGETKITPFNMKEEMEEGYVDGTGMYIWNKKDASEIKDSWLDSVDWAKIAAKKASKELEDDEDSMELPRTSAQIAKDATVLYKEIITYLQPGENLLKAIKRYGGGGKQMSASEKLKMKKMANKADGGEAEKYKSETQLEKEKSDIENVTKITEIANNILSITGNMDIYQETFESINYKISRQDSKTAALEKADDLDMFSDEFSNKEKDNNEPSTSTSKVDDNNDNDDLSGEEVKWEFKWEDKADAKIYGPHSSLEMYEWDKEGYFKDGVLVRKFKRDSDFYSSKRIDFDLYC